MRLLHQLDVSTPLAIDGRTLSLEQVVAVARGRRRVTVDAAARHRVACCREMVEVLLEQNEKVYGLTTGFGKLRDVVIDPEDTVRLQRNLIMSHAVGVGPVFPEEVVRAAILLRANTLCRGNSGVRPLVIERLVAMLNDDLYPYVPQKGSVGASGDLAPLSHLGLVLIGHPEGRYLPRRRGDGQPVARSRPEADEFEAMPPAERLEEVAAEQGWSFRPLTLEAKEGLAINNGTQFMTAVAALAIYDGEFAVRWAELAGALSLEAQRGVRAAYDPRLHAVRQSPEQQRAAKRVIAYSDGSQILDLYLNSAHLYRARQHLAEAGEFLATAGEEMEASGLAIPAAVRQTESELVTLAEEIDGAIPTDADGRPDEAMIADRSALPPRIQIDRFTRLLRPQRQRALDLLRRVESETFPRTSVSDKVRSAMVAAVRQLNEAVPDAPIVQDDYSFRCFPQVLACAYRALGHAAEVVTAELNSANDNPLLFPPQPEPGLEAMAVEDYAAWLRADPERLEACRDGVVGGGNFHGEPIGIAMDYLAIALAEVGSIAERRVAHLVDENHSRGLPSFLIEESGLNSGFMLVQYTAAALVSENKGLCHPASVDSIPTCANTEDHVAMATIAARQAAGLLENLLDVIAIELLTAYQAIGFRRPLAPGKPLRRFIEAFAAGGIERYERDRVPHPDLVRIRELMREPELLDCLL